MGQRLLSVRVRPPRVAVLVRQDPTNADLLLILEFFSKLWGGRFHQFFVVNPGKADALTRHRLGSTRPDFVYGLGIDDAHWSQVTRAACQPRAYSRLEADYVKDMRQRSSPKHCEEFALADHALLHLSRTRNGNLRHKRILRIVEVPDQSPMSLLCAVAFGISPPSLRPELYDEMSTCGNTVPEFIQLATLFAENWERSWLDVTAHELEPHVGFGLSGAILPPTVVLVGGGEDLSLFWNLRTATSASMPSWVIPIPNTSATDPRVLQGLRDWLVALLRYPWQPNYCDVTSQTVSELACRQFASDLEALLKGTAIEAVDFVPPRNGVPVVVPFEYETTWPVEIVRRRLTIVPPRPKAFEGIGPPFAWFVDLRKDIATGRSVSDLQLPSTPVVYELLNGPCPPGFYHSVIDRTGDGTDSPNIRCTEREDAVNIHLPSGREILCEILHEHGLVPVRDEKRSCYLPVISRFGGLHAAAEALSGKTGGILSSLIDHTLTIPDIQSRCQLGRGDVPGSSYAERVSLFLVHETERMQRVGRQRFATYARHRAPENLRLSSVLEYWADKSVLKREWKVGPCRHCGKSSFMPTLDIQRSVECPFCGYRISLRGSIPIGYALDPTVCLAIKEGLAPVVLTGRFLRNLTHRGFFWLPGVKYREGSADGDVDIVACCDGCLIFSECKSLAGTASDAKGWDDAVDQFLDTAAVAKRCAAHAVVLAAHVDEYPERVLERIRIELAGSIPHLLLTKADLDVGHREVQSGNSRQRYALSDLIPSPLPERRRQRPDGRPRTIRMG